MSLLENALDSLLVEAAFAFPRDDSAFLIQLPALKVSVMYKQNQALDKDQQFNWKAFYFIAYIFIAITLMKKAVHCAMPVHSSVIMICFAMNCIKVLAHHLPITKSSQNQVIFTSTNFFLKLGTILLSGMCKHHFVNCFHLHRFHFHHLMTLLLLIIFFIFNIFWLCRYVKINEPSQMTTTN